MKFIETIIFTGILLLGPTIISLPFVSLWKINHPKRDKRFWIFFITIILIVTFIWDYIWLTQVLGVPYHL